MHAGGLAGALVCLDHIPARDRDEILASAVRERGRLLPGQLRILDSERRGLAHLPANQLIEILLLRRDLLEPDE